MHHIRMIVFIFQVNYIPAKYKFSAASFDVNQNLTFPANFQVKCLKGLVIERLQNIRGTISHIKLVAIF